MTASVIAALDGLLASSGNAESAYNLRGMPAKEKARIALARLRDAGIDGVRLLEVSLAVTARITDRGPGDTEFMEVQIAKRLHRLASGTHTTSSGIPIRSKYPQSSGQVLRIVGHRVRDIAALVSEPAVETVIDLARPAVAVFEKADATRRDAEELVAREIMRTRSFFEGPHGSEHLAKYERQLRRQHGLK